MPKNIHADCLDNISIDADALLDHWYTGKDRVIREYQHGDVSEYGDSGFYYLVVETNQLPGHRVVQIWHKSWEDINKDVH